MAIDHFESQFNSPVAAEKSGVNFNVIRVEPKHFTSETPVIITPGWGGPEAVYKGIMQSFYDSGRTTLFPLYPIYDRPRSRNPVTILMDVRNAKNATISGIIEIFGEEYAGSRRVDGLGYSAGAIDLILAISGNEESLRKLLLIAPAGISDQGFIRTLNRIISGAGKSDAIDEERKKENLATEDIINENQRSTKHYVDQNKVGAYGEVLGMAWHTVQDRFPAFKEKGVPIGVIAHEKDLLFPLDVIHRTAAHSVDKFIVGQGVHGELQYNKDFQKQVVDTLAHL